MVEERLEFLGNIKGAKGDQGVKGDTGTFAGANAVSVPASQPAEVFLTGPETAKVANFRIPRGLPGTNALANDEAFATYIAAIDTETRIALEHVFTPKGVFSVNIADLGAVIDGSGDSTPPVQAAIDAWSGAFGTLVFTAPPRSTIRTTGWVVQGKSVMFDFQNSHLVQTAAAEIIRAEGEWGPVAPVVSASRATVTMADTSGFAERDIVKVFSSNVIWDARPRIPDDYPTTQPTEFARQGEFARVTAVSGNTLTISPPLFDTYDGGQNIRIAKLIEHDVQVRFGTAENEGAGTGTMFRFNSLRFPYVNGRVLKGSGTAFGFRSCFGAVSDVRVSNLPQGTGYAVASSGGVMGQHRIHATNVRHAYTDDTAGRYTAADAGSDPANYGRAMFDTIMGQSFSTSEASWDTHHGGIGHQFIGIKGTGASAGTSPIFSVRGRFHRFDDCVAFGGSLGFRVHTESNGAESWAVTENIEFNNCSTRDTYSGIEVVLVNYIPTTRGVNLTINGGTFEARQGQLANWSRARVRFNGNPVFRHTLEAAPTGAITNFFNCGLVDFRGEFTIDAMAITSGSQTDIVSFANAGTSWQSLNVKVNLDLSDYMRANVGTLFRLATARGLIQAVINGTTTASLTAAATTTPDQMALTLRTIGSNASAGSSAIVPVELTANGATLSAARSADPAPTIRAYTAANRSVAGISVATFGGQRLLVLNAPSSTGTLTIPSGATNTNLTADVVLSPGQGAQFVWDGTSSLWVRF